LSHTRSIPDECLAIAARGDCDRLPPTKALV